jgi:hypothetical protein
MRQLDVDVEYVQMKVSRSHLVLHYPTLCTATLPILHAFLHNWWLETFMRPNDIHHHSFLRPKSVAAKFNDSWRDIITSQVEYDSTETGCGFYSKFAVFSQ